MSAGSVLWVVTRRGAFVSWGRAISPGRFRALFLCRQLPLPCRASGQLCPHLGRLAFAGASAYLSQVLLERFELAGPLEAAVRLVAGDHLGESLEELVIVIVDMRKNDRACLLGAW